MTRCASVPATARHVLLTLAVYADEETGEAWPSVNTLMADTGLSRSTVQRALQALTQCGAVVVKHAAGEARASTTYALTLDAHVTPRGVSVTPGGCQPEAPPVSERGPNYQENSHENGQSDPPSPLEEHFTVKRSAPAEDDQPLEGLLFQVPASAAVEPVDVFDEFWAGYPRKTAKVDARKAWSTATKRHGAEPILAGLRAQGVFLSSLHERGRCWYPATWLRAESWADEGILREAAFMARRQEQLSTSVIGDGPSAAEFAAARRQMEAVQRRYRR